MHPLDDGEQGTRKYAALTSTSSGHSEQATVEVVLSQLAQDRDYRCFSASAEYCDIGQNAGVLCGRHPVRQFTLLTALPAAIAVRCRNKPAGLALFREDFSVACSLAVG